MRSSHRSSMSRHRSSMSHRSSLSRHRHTIGTSHSRMRKHGISNIHAFAVGRATGVNINGSAMGAHGAFLHRSLRRRKSMDSSSSHRSNFSCSILNGRLFRSNSSVHAKFHDIKSLKNSCNFDFFNDQQNINNFWIFILIPIFGFLIAFIFMIFIFSKIMVFWL